MNKMSLENLKDCEDLLEGGLWMGTGGGGSYDDGMTLLKGALESGLSLEWVDVESIPDDVWTATIGLHGTIAPISRETQNEINRMGLKDNMGDMFLAEAVKELGEYMGYEFGSPAHSDGVVLNPSVWLDEMQIEEDGRYTHPALVELCRQMGMGGY